MRSTQEERGVEVSPPARIHLEMSVVIKNVAIPAGLNQKLSPNNGARILTPNLLRRTHVHL